MRTLQDGTRIVWEPLDGSQTLAMSCPANVILYEGTRGPGKTDAQLHRFHRNVGLGYGRFWRGAIFDREYKNLDDLVSKSLRWFPQLRTGGRFLASKSDYRWIWPGGEELLFRVVKKQEHYWNYHGQEFPFLGWNELTKFPDPGLFEAMMSCNRSSFRPEDYPIWVSGEHYKRGQILHVPKKAKGGIEVLLPEIPLEVFATTNPFGVGHNWVKHRFIDCAKRGQIVKTSAVVFDPKLQQDREVVKTQVAIFGSYKENKYLSAEYILELEKITDPNKRKAWLEGDWSITAGGMFDDLWSAQHHVVEPFEIPRTWKLTRSYDDGSAKPFSVGWWAISDGTPYVTKSGKIVSTISGDCFRFAEWYGCVEGKYNMGLNLTASQISAGIAKREIEFGFRDRIVAGPADGNIFNEERGNSVASEMAKMVRLDDGYVTGVSWTRANKSRIDGWKTIREYLLAALPQKRADGSVSTRDRPGLYVFSNCKDFIRLFPGTVRDEEKLDDVDTESEDHLQDETRYFIASVAVGMRTGTTRG